MFLVYPGLCKLHMNFSWNTVMAACCGAEDEGRLAALVLKPKLEQN